MRPGAAVATGKGPAVTKAEVSKLVALLMACYPNARFEPGTGAAYEGFLSELEHEQAKRAIGDAVRASKFLPTIAEVFTAYEALAPKKPSTSYRLFKPRDESGSMAPGELKAAIEDFLKKGKAS